MTKRLQTLLGQIAIDDTQRTRVREEARACIEWLKEEEATTREDADTWTHLAEGLRDVPMVSPHYERVRTFMERADQDTPLEYTPLDEPTRILRAKLILEEALETIEALGVQVVVTNEPLVIDDETWKIEEFEVTDWKNIPTMEFFHLNTFCPLDIEQLIDGLTDLSVVTVGTFIAMGLPDLPFLRETDRANLEKFEVPKCPECGATMLYVELGTGTMVWRCVEHEPFITLSLEAGPYTRPDGKHIKPPYHTPPAHTQIAHSLGVNLTTNEVP